MNNVIFLFYLTFCASIIAKSQPLIKSKINITIHEDQNKYKYACLLNSDDKTFLIKRLLPNQVTSFNKEAISQHYLKISISTQKMETFAKWDTTYKNTKSMRFSLDTSIISINLNESGEFTYLGGPVNRGYTYLTKELEDLPKKYYSGDSAIIKMVGKGNSPFFWRHNKYKEFVRNNPGNTASFVAFSLLMAISSPLDDIDEIKSLFKTLDTSLKNTKSGEYYEKAIVAREKEVSDRQAIKYKSFNLLDSSIHIRKMENYSKLLFVDMWASWCVPCRDATPMLKKMKEKYGDQMDFISISIDDDAVKWMKANREENFGWQSLLIPKTADSAFIKHYSINLVPTFILFDRNGNTLKRIHGIWFFTDLEKILNDYLIAHP